MVCGRSGYRQMASEVEILVGKSNLFRSDLSLTDQACKCDTVGARIPKMTNASRTSPRAYEPAIKSYRTGPR